MIGPAWKGLLNQCGRKARYTSSEAAWWAARNLQRGKTTEPRREGPWPYWCEVCEGWHVGHERPVS